MAIYAGLTGQQMLDRVGVRVEDPDKKKWTEALKLPELNSAMVKVANLLDNHLLTELQIYDTNKTVTTGVMAFSVLSNPPLRNAILNVRVTSGKFCTIMEVEDLKRTENSYLAGSTTNPLVNVFKESLYFNPTTVTACDVWYLRAPTALAADATVCELNPALHDVVCRITEAEIWLANNQVPRADAAEKKAMDIIAMLNARYAIEQPTGIGAKATV